MNRAPLPWRPGDRAHCVAAPWLGQISIAAPRPGEWRFVDDVREIDFPDGTSMQLLRFAPGSATGQSNHRWFNAACFRKAGDHAAPRPDLAAKADAAFIASLKPARVIRPASEPHKLADPRKLPEPHKLPDPRKLQLEWDAEGLVHQIRQLRAQARAAGIADPGPVVGTVLFVAMLALATFAVIICGAWA